MIPPHKAVLTLDGHHYLLPYGVDDPQCHALLRALTGAVSSAPETAYYPDEVRKSRPGPGWQSRYVTQSTQATVSVESVPVASVVTRQEWEALKASVQTATAEPAAEPAAEKARAE